jgi:hypothetical protein
MTVEYTYAKTELGRDYVRAIIGLAICAAPFAWVMPAKFIMVILGVMAAVFSVLLWQTVMRQITRVILDETGITLVALRRRTIPWDRLERFDLSYFTTWKNLKGFMEIKLKGAGTSMRIGSGLAGFREIAQTATVAATRNRLNFNAATIDNLRSIGIPDPRIDPEDHV